MSKFIKLFILTLACLVPGVVHAGAWPLTPGQTQLIVSYEPGSADKAFDVAGNKAIALGKWDQTDASVFIDHGVTDRLTVTTKINYKDYRTDLTSFSGVSSVEIGGRWTVHKGDDYVFAIGASLEGLGHGRRSDFDTAVKQGTDTDLRAYFGKSFRVGKADAFINLETARHLREKDADQWRVDATFGVKPAVHWMVMAQSFSGQTDRQSWGQAKWTHAQLSVVRSFGPNDNTSLQLAVRQTIAGRNVPAVNAVIFSVWRTF